MVICPKDLNKFGAFSLKDIDAVLNLCYKATIDESSGAFSEYSMTTQNHLNWAE